MDSVYGPRAEYYQMSVETSRPLSVWKTERTVTKLGYIAPKERDVHRAHFHVLHVLTNSALDWERRKLLLEDWLGLFKPQLGSRDWIVFCPESDGVSAQPMAYSIRTKQNLWRTPVYFIWQSALEVPLPNAGSDCFFFALFKSAFRGPYCEHQPDLESFIQCCIRGEGPFASGSGSTFSTSWTAAADKRNERLFCARFFEKRPCTELWTNFCTQTGCINFTCTFEGDVYLFDVVLDKQLTLRLAGDCFVYTTAEQWRRLLQWLANHHYQLTCIGTYTTPSGTDQSAFLDVRVISHNGWLVYSKTTLPSRETGTYKIASTIIAPKSVTHEQKQTLVDFCRAPRGIEPLEFSLDNTLVREHGFARIDKIRDLFLRCVLCFAPLGFPELITRHILEYAYPKFLLMYEAEQTATIVRVKKALADAREARAKEEALEVIEQAAKKQRI